jgi:hypothetical protein
MLTFRTSAVLYRDSNQGNQNLPKASKKSPFPPKTDFFSKYGAGLLAEHIQKVWVKRGHGNVVATIEKIASFPSLWAVKSNLVNGLPPARVKRGRPLGAEMSAALRASKAEVGK